MRRHYDTEGSSGALHAPQGTNKAIDTQMLVVEILGVLVVAIVLITTIIAVGAPVATMLANKTKYKYDALGTEAEVKLKERISSLEEEVRDLRKQLLEVKDASDFAVRLLEKSGVDTRAISAHNDEQKRLEDNERKK